MRTGFLRRVHRHTFLFAKSTDHTYELITLKIHKTTDLTHSLYHLRHFCLAFSRPVISTVRRFHVLHFIQSAALRSSPNGFHWRVHFRSRTDRQVRTFIHTSLLRSVKYSWFPVRESVANGTSVTQTQ